MFSEGGVSSAVRSLLRCLALGSVSAFVGAAAQPEARADFSLGSLGLSANSLISPDVVKSLVGLTGFGLQHRPYEPATPLGVAVGIDFSLEVTLFKIPDSLFTSLSALGAPATSPIPALPIAKLHLHKGMGDFVDIGGSIFYLPGNWIVGADAKFVFLQGEEGPTYAFRFCYTYVDMNISGSEGSFNLTTTTYSPQLVVSRQMDFADPYMGVALEYARGGGSGTITVPANLIGPIPAGVTIPPIPYDSPTETAFGAYAFGGVSLRVPRTGVRVTIEGSYNTAGESTMGTKVGFTF